MFYARGVGAVLGGASVLMGGLQQRNQLSSQISDANNRIELTKTQRDRDVRSLKREGAEFMSRQRAFIARSGAAGTSSGHVLQRHAANEASRGVTRVHQDASNKVAMLKAQRANLKTARTMSMVNMIIGAAAPMLQGGAPTGTPQTQLPPIITPTAPQVSPSRGIAGRRRTGTSRRGGIGGF